MQSTLSIKKSELLKIRTAFCQCRFPSLAPQAIKMRKKHREDPEFRSMMVAHNQKIAKTKKYSPEKYEKLVLQGVALSSDPVINAARTKTLRGNVIRKKSNRRVYDPIIYDRPNDYAGVVTMSEYNSL